MLNKLKIGPKLVGGFLVVTGITLLVGFVGMLSVNRIVQANTFLYEKVTKPVVELVGIAMSFEIILRESRDMVRENDSEKIEQIISSVDEYREEMNRSIEHYKTTLVDEEDKKLFEGLISTNKTFKNNIEKLYKLARENSDSQAIALLDGQFSISEKNVESAIDSLEAMGERDAMKNAEENRSVANTTTILLIVVLLCGILFAVFTGLWLTGSITKPLNKGVQTMMEMAKGNMMVTFDPRSLSVADETGILTRAMKDMADKLRETIAYTLESSENVSTGSIQLSSSSQGISQGSSEQAASVEEISASIEQISSSIEEMTASINQNAENANQTEKIAMKSSADARDGGEAVQKTVVAMKQIAEKISIIQEIARQTNLLSLNASIEAARAGEHGKGFAVVASAVQKLAERSQDAAEEISKLSRSSVDVAENAGEMLKRLVPDIQKTADLVSEINAASTEQNTGIQQVNTAVQQVNAAIQQFNQVVQSNASASEELASTSEELSTQAEELKNRISYFKIERTAIVHKRDENRVRRLPAVSQSHFNSSGAIHKEKPEQVFTDDGSMELKNGVTITMDDDDENFKRV